MNRLALFSALMLLTGTKLPAGWDAPVGTCPECGRKTRDRHCTGDSNHKRPQRRVVVEVPGE
jgi:hypothetical protein